MNVVAILTVVVVMSMLAVDICHGESLTCDQLPKVGIPSMEVLNAHSPYSADFTLSSRFDCATKIYTNPPRGTTNYYGTALTITRSGVIAYDFAVDPDNTVRVTLCSNGAKGNWYAAAMEFNKTGGFYCIYTCNGSELEEYICGSNNNGTSPAELEAVKKAESVSNGHLIHDAKQNCPARHGCNAF